MPDISPETLTTLVRVWLVVAFIWLLIAQLPYFKKQSWPVMGLVIVTIAVLLLPVYPGFRRIKQETHDSLFNFIGKPYEERLDRANNLNTNANLIERNHMVINQSL